MQTKWRSISKGGLLETEPVRLGEIENVWDHSWHKTGKTVQILDPIYNQPHIFNVYRIEDTIFAAGEFSNMVWGFYVPSTD